MGSSILPWDISGIIVSTAGCTGSVVACINPLTSIMMGQTAKFSPKVWQQHVLVKHKPITMLRSALNGRIQLVYISLEGTINNAHYRSMLLSPWYKEKLVMLVADEAHCVRTWEDKFRVAFTRIGELWCHIPSNVHILALTATAIRSMLHVVSERLTLKNVAVFCSPTTLTLHIKFTPFECGWTHVHHLPAACNTIYFPKDCNILPKIPRLLSAFPHDTKEVGRSNHQTTKLSRLPPVWACWYLHLCFHCRNERKDSCFFLCVW